MHACNHALVSPQPETPHLRRRYLNILQAIQLPFAMLPALHFASSARHLGRFRSPPLLVVVAIGVASVILATNGSCLVQLVDLDNAPFTAALAAVGLFLYLGLCVRLIWDDLRWLARYGASATRRAVCGAAASGHGKLLGLWRCCTRCDSADKVRQRRVACACACVRRSQRRRRASHFPITTDLLPSFCPASARAAGGLDGGGWLDRA